MGANPAETIERALALPMITNGIARMTPIKALPATIPQASKMLF